jgi:hypothetical protein
MLRIGITGHARAGKDTAAEIISKHHKLLHINFADALKADLVKLDPLVDPYFGLHLSEALKVNDGNLELIKNHYPEWRRLCQRYGTEVRRAEDPNIWVERLVDAVFETIYTRGVLYPGYVVGDLRFPNEREGLLWNAVIKVTRPGVAAANDHIAEAYIDDMPADYIIENDGTLDEFEQKVLDVMALVYLNREDKDEVPVPYDDGEEYDE